jgi:peptidoglycan-associated lipoprotein
MKTILMCVAAAGLLGACSTTPKPISPFPMNATPPQATPAKLAAAAAPPALMLPPYKDPSNILYKERSVYFDFDNYAVKPIYMTALSAHGQYLGSTASMKIRVAGNSDDRGSSEYNLALGQRRAEAVKKMLLTQGAKESQIEAVSYGKEKPRAAGSDEAAWAQNRRADIVYP